MTKDNGGSLFLHPHEVAPIMSIKDFVEAKRIGLLEISVKIHNESRNIPYEIDVLLLCRHRFYVIELKHFKGDVHIQSDKVMHNGKKIPDPRFTNNEKAQLILGRYREMFPQQSDWVKVINIIVFTHPEVDVHGHDSVDTFNSDYRGYCFRSLDDLFTYLDQDLQRVEHVIDQAVLNKFFKSVTENTRIARENSSNDKLIQSELGTSRTDPKLKDALKRLVELQAEFQKKEKKHLGDMEKQKNKIADLTNKLESVTKSQSNDSTAVKEKDKEIGKLREEISKVRKTNQQAQEVSMEDLKKREIKIGELSSKLESMTQSRTKDAQAVKRKEMEIQNLEKEIKQVKEENKRVQQETEEKLGLLIADLEGKQKEVREGREAEAKLKEMEQRVESLEGTLEDSKRGIRAVSEYVLNNLREETDYEYFSTGSGKQDYGFFVLGIPSTKQCYHAFSHLFAIVFSMFQISKDARPGNFIREFQDRVRFQLNYSRIQRLQLTILLMIRNNMIKENTIAIKYDGNPFELEAAVENINFYSALVADLAKLDYEPLVVVLNPEEGIQINLDGEVNEQDGVRICNSRERLSKRSSIWNSGNINFQIEDEDREHLRVLLRDFLLVDHFYPGQFEALQKMLNSDDENALCIMPTGTGKSLIIYMLALLQANPTLVLCPTEVLIQDQMHSLKHKHRFDDVCCLNVADKQSFVFANKINFVTPETFLNHDLILHVIGVNYHQKIAHIVLDEVHCISNWSHDFRAEYLMLSFNLREYVDKTAYKCFTATASFTVVSDLLYQLDISEDQIISPLDNQRDNFVYRFIHCSSFEDMMLNLNRRIELSVSEFHETGCKTIVFTKNDEITKQVCSHLLSRSSHQVISYLNGDILSYRDFVDKDYPMLIASQELGIGVDLPGVNETVHFGLPTSKKQFIQECGRAGRSYGVAMANVIFQTKYSLEPKMRKLLSRSTSIDEVVDIVKNTGTRSDLIDSFRKILGTSMKEFEFQQMVREVYKKLVEVIELNVKKKNANRTSGFYLTELVPPNQDKNEFARDMMNCLYVLYRTGVIYAWYLSDSDEQSKSLKFFIDPCGPSMVPKTCAEMKQHTIDYLLRMGDYKKEAAAIRNSDSEEKVIANYLAWYYRQYLYHHREQMIEMYDFLEVYHDKGSEEIAKVLGNHLSLSIMSVRSDIKYLQRLTISEIILLVEQIDHSFVESVRSGIENEYDAKLDFFLFVHSFTRTLKPDIDRLDRVVDHLDYSDYDELLNNLNIFFENMNVQLKMQALRILCKRNTLRVVFDRLYSRVEKDDAFYLIMAWIASKRLGEIPCSTKLMI